MNDIYNWFWYKIKWFPPGITWEDLKSTDDFHKPKIEDLVFALVNFTTLFIFVRYCVIEPYVIVPVAKQLGIKQAEGTKDLPPLQTLENLFNLLIRKSNNLHSNSLKFYSKIPRNDVEKAASQLGWTEWQIRLWLKRRSQVTRNRVLAKFCDCSFQLVYYVTFCIFGVTVLWNKIWLWDLNHSWNDYPHHRLDEGIRYYYYLSIGFYSSSSLTVFLEQRRSDSRQMLMHHGVTLILLCFSWAMNFVRIGSLILIIHECADVPLLAAKLCNYTGSNVLKDIFFMFFVVLWVMTRLVVYPFCILKNMNAFVDPRDRALPFYIMRGLLWGLMLMHILWTFLILKVILRKFTSNSVKDVRSDDELDEMSSDDDNKSD